MSYTITLTTLKDSPDTLTLVEKTCWHYGGGATWTEHDGHQILTMGSSGTSGMLRFHSSSGELFSVVLGVYNYKPWCNALVDLEPSEAAVKLHAEYYAGGRFSREIPSEVQKVSKGWKHVRVFFDGVDGGHEIRAVVQHF
ncbi:fungal fruit body lectin [Aspergillus karnatakaensis]|uniref:uncharacterized protein n=1 Tax=Aspergillus karnatakaensis TaxID=1810916 RepID=UPI003CCDDCEC